MTKSQNSLQLRAVELYRIHKSLRKVGDILGCSHEMIRTCLSAQKETIGEPGGRRKLPRDKERSACAEYKKKKGTLSIKRLAEKNGVSNSTMTKVLRRNDTETVAARTIPVRYDVFDRLNDTSAYWLGYLFARGYIRSGRVIEIQARKGEFIGRKKEFARFLGIKTNKERRHSIIVSCKYMVDRLTELGCGPAYKWKYPKEIANTSVERHFVRGFVEGRLELHKTTDDLTIQGNRTFLIEMAKRMRTNHNYDTKIQRRTLHATLRS
jgi:lambda repressor-like predicted transcriptional regulator